MNVNWQTNLSKRQTWRFIIIAIFLIVAACCVLWRLLNLHVFERSFLMQQSYARIMRVIDLPAYRGRLLDRQGNPLAISTPVAAVWVEPKQFQASETQLQQLADVLQVSVESLNTQLSQAANREFVYLKRQLEPRTAKKVAQLKLSGIHILPEYRRYYPEGEVTAQVLGFTNIDDQGQEGLELAFNDWLQGEPGKQRVIKDRIGRVIAQVERLKEPVMGQTITLSLDRRIQYLAYSALRDAVNEHQAQAGSAIVLNAKTGEVLAMVNMPTFNPNSRDRSEMRNIRNRAVTDLFEPASALKTFSMSNALLYGKYEVDTIIDTTPGWFKLGQHTVRDIRPLGKITFAEVLQRSSNVGVSKITLALPSHSLAELLASVGFGRQTESGFPGESSGVLAFRDEWKPIELATLSYGYGISVTVLQMAKAYMVYANHGQQYPITLLKQTQPPLPMQILPETVADTTLALLEQVVERSAVKAKIPGYRIAGKTGTARMVGETGYLRNHHNALFVGLAPVSDPQLIVVVYLHDPQANRYYASQIVAPVFATIMQGALHMLEISPDAESTA